MSILITFRFSSVILLLYVYFSILDHEFISSKIFIYALSIKPWIDLAGGFLTHI